VKNKRLLLFETDPLLIPWLCYHPRQKDVYFNNRSIRDAPAAFFSRFAKVSDLANVDFVTTRDRIVDPRAPGVSSPNLVDNPRGVDRMDGYVRWHEIPSANQTQDHD
jgi:hypothetical protein